MAADHERGGPAAGTVACEGVECRTKSHMPKRRSALQQTQHISEGYRVSFAGSLLGQTSDRLAQGIAHQ